MTPLPAKPLNYTAELSQLSVEIKKKLKQQFAELFAQMDQKLTILQTNMHSTMWNNNNST